MRLFCHISEFGSTGWFALPTTILLTKRVSIWAPSFRELKADYEANRTVIEPKHIIELIERRRIQVMARREWIFDKKARNSNPFWEHSKWDDSYDEELKKIAERYQGPDPTEHLVRIMPKERGWRWAGTQKESGLYYKRAAERYQKKELPLGMIEKADHYAQGGGDPIRCVLRDAKNYEDALMKSGAWAPFEPSEYPDSISYIMKRRSAEVVGEAELDWPKIRELFHVARRITHIRSGDDLIRRVENNELSSFESELENLLRTDTIPVANRLRESIATGAAKSLDLSWISALWPKSKLDATLTVAGLVVSAASASLSTPLGAACTILSFGLLGAQTVAGSRVLARASMIPTDYTGPVLPFFLMFGVTKPKLDQIRSMLEALERLC